jgi:hypothetical protein
LFVVFGRIVYVLGLWKALKSSEKWHDNDKEDCPDNVESAVFVLRRPFDFI